MTVGTIQAAHGSVRLEAAPAPMQALGISRSQVRVLRGRNLDAGAESMADRRSPSGSRAPPSPTSRSLARFIARGDRATAWWPDGRL